MAGLLSGGGPEMPQPMSNPQVVDGATSETGDVDPMGESNVSPEEQENYDKLVMAAKKLMYSEQGQPGVMGMLGKDPAAIQDNIGRTTAYIVQKLDEESGGQVPEDIIMPAAMEIMADVAEMAEAAGMFEFTDGNLMGATQATIAAVAGQYGQGPEEIEEMMQMYGDDDQVMSTMEDFFKNAGAGVQPTSREGGPEMPQ